MLFSFSAQKKNKKKTLQMTCICRIVLYQRARVIIVPPILKQEIYACSFRTSAFLQLSRHETVKETLKEIKPEEKTSGIRKLHILPSPAKRKTSYSFQDLHYHRNIHSSKHYEEISGR